MSPVDLRATSPTFISCVPGRYHEPCETAPDGAQRFSPGPAIALPVAVVETTIWHTLDTRHRPLCRRPDHHHRVSRARHLRRGPSSAASTPGGVADERFAVRLREERERKHWSQADVARFMTERGWSWPPQTVQRIEAGHRKVSVGEAKALAEIIGTTVDRLTWPGKEASAAGLLTMFTVRAEQAWQQVATWTSTLLHAQRQLTSTLSSVERDGYFRSDEIRRIADEARYAIKLSPEEAVAEARRDKDGGGRRRGPRRIGRGMPASPPRGVSGRIRHLVWPMISAMADEVRLEGRDAANIARYLNSLANLVDPEMGPPYELVRFTEPQRRALTGGSALGDRPAQLAELFRRYVAEIYGQLGDDAPEL